MKKLLMEITEKEAISLLREKSELTESACKAIVQNHYGPFNLEYCVKNYTEYTGVFDFLYSHWKNDFKRALFDLQLEITDTLEDIEYAIKTYIDLKTNVYDAENGHLIVEDW